MNTMSKPAVAALLCFISGSAQCADWWRPSVDTLWQWQLSVPEIDARYVADVYDVDLFDVDAAAISSLKELGRAAICYISVGSWENWRPDAGSFPAEVLGNRYDGWAGERWLDIRQIDQLAPIMEARLDLCRDKGFVGVEPDNMDGYQNNTGFPLTAADQLAYNIWLANAAHARGLSIGMKNDPDQVADLVDLYDWALTEDCFDEGWCAEMTPFIEAGKPVFAAEYTDTGITTGEFCAPATLLGIQAILKDRDLTEWRENCGGQEFYRDDDILVESQSITAGQSVTYATLGAIQSLGSVAVGANGQLDLRGDTIRISGDFIAAEGSRVRMKR